MARVPKALTQYGLALNRRAFEFRVPVTFSAFKQSALSYTNEISELQDTESCKALKYY